MSIKFANAGAASGLSRAQIVGLGLVGLVGLGGSGVLAYHLIAGPRSSGVAMSGDEAKIAARGEERRARSEADARKLRQQDLGQGYQFDAQGNLLGAATDVAVLPQNRTLQSPGSPSERSSPAAAAIGRGIDSDALGANDLYDSDDHEEAKGKRSGGVSEDDLDEGRSEAPKGAALTASMLGYSTVPGVGWATQRPESAQAGVGRAGAGTATSKGRPTGAMDRLVDTVEESTKALTHQTASTGDQTMTRAQTASPTGTATYWGGPMAVSPGPSASGDSLYASDKAPALHAPQSFVSGTIGDMRIGGQVGPDQIVREGKFLDCAVVNQIRADLVDSPVIAMVARDFVSLDGKYVLVPAGSKLLGEAGRVQNLQQERVYIKFDRIIFPDQRSAYFPVRKVPAVDGVGAVGVAGDVDRHLFMQFGAAVMLGILDGLGAAVQSPSAATNPTLRDLVMARTSADFSTVMSGVIQKYANVVPTVTVEAGAKIKVFFSDDVRLSPYLATSSLTWVRER